MGELRTIGKHGLIYGAGIVFAKLASFVMLPIYTRYLTPADYGVLELLSMMIDVAGILATVGIGAGLFKFYSDAASDAERAVVMSTAALLSAGLSALVAAVGISIAPMLSELVLGPHGDAMYVRVFFAAFFLGSTQLVPLALLQAQHRSLAFVGLNAGKLLASLGLNILFVVYYGAGLRGVMITVMVVEVVFATILSAYLVHQTGIRFSAAAGSALLRFGRPIVLYSLASFVVVFSDRFFLRSYRDVADVGIYSLAYKFAFVLSALAYSPFETAWAPRRFEIAKRPNGQAMISRAFLYLNVLLGVLAAGIALFAGDLLAVMSAPAFRGAALVVPVLAAAQIFFIWTSFCVLGLYHSGRSEAMSRVGVVVVLATLAANWALIPWLGIWGAALATLAVYLVRFLLTFRAAQRAHRIDYGWARVIRLYAVIAVAVLVGAWNLDLARHLALLLHASLFAFVVLATWLYALAAEDRRVIQGAAADVVRAATRMLGVTSPRPQGGGDAA